MTAERVEDGGPHLLEQLLAALLAAAEGADLHRDFNRRGGQGLNPAQANLHLQPRLPADPLPPEVARHADVEDTAVFILAAESAVPLLAKAVELESCRAERQAGL